MKSYEEIKLAIESFPAQSPELRAEKLLNLLNKSKKRFAQLYAILLWLHEDHVQKYLQSTNDLKYDLMNQTNRLNMKQDTLYYLHNNLYGKRIKSLEINESFHILLHEKYEKLPSSITLCRNLPTPPEQDHRLLIEQLNILIRSKLLLLEQLPVQYSSVNIMNGMLILTLDHYYEVILSLAHLRNYEAPWAVLSVRILTHNHESERLLGDYDPRDVNAKVLQILTKVVALENCKNPLLQIHRVCLYTAQSQSLRLLYVQALDMTRTSLIGIAEANYVELPDQIAFRCLFWKEKETEMIETSLLADAENSEKSSKYLYELTVSLMRPQQGKVHFHALPVLLFEVKEISSQTALFHDDISSNFEVFRLPNGEKFIEKGVSFGALYHSTLNLCSIRQLTSLYTVIRRSAILQQALSCGLILTGPETTAKISFTYKSVEVGIAISAKDGSFVVSSTSLAVVLEGIFYS